MSEPFLGEIRPFGFDWAPVGWGTCAGQLLSIAQNTALFSLVGTTYGGDGQSTFALPDLRGNTPIGTGQGPGLSAYSLGEQAGTTAVTLNQNEMPSHSHTPQSSAIGSDRNPFPIPAGTGGRWAPSDHAQYATAPPDVTMAPGLIGISGGSQPHSNESPYLAISFCIALEGIYPSRP